MSAATYQEGLTGDVLRRIMTRMAHTEVMLASGGSVVLKAEVDFFALSEEDRRLIFQLVDLLTAYRDRAGRLDAGSGRRK